MPNAASRQSHLEISFSLSFVLHLIPFFMTTCSCKGFAFSPKNDQCTACGRVIVAGPTGLSRHLARSPLCSKDYEAQLNPRHQQLLFPSMLLSWTVSPVDDGRQSEADFIHIIECNNFTSSLISQNCTQWNLDFRFPLATLFLERIIQLHIIYNEHRLAPHLFRQN